MKKLQQIVFVTTLIAMTSCSSSKMVLSGSNAPKYENQPVMYGELRKQKLGMTNSYTIDSAQWISYLKQYNVPELVVFDKDGNYIPYRLKATSPSNAQKAIDSICSGSFRKHSAFLAHDDKNYSLKDEFNRLHSADGQKVNATMFPDADYTVFIYFNNQMKSMNKKYVYQWEQKIEQQNGPCNISIVKVNLTPQTWWSGVEPGKQVNVAPKGK